MNILLQSLPTAVEIDGVEYKLNTDYRVGIKIMLAFEDSELTEEEKQLVALDLLYEDIPENIPRAVELAANFLNCGKEGGKEGEAGSERVYSFEHDAPYIFTAIKQTHGVDLETVEYLHWWKFYYMFLDLGENCFFSMLIDLRSRRSQGRLTKEEREYCLRIGEILDLPEHFGAKEKSAQNEFISLLKKD